MKHLILGAAGFIGTNLAIQLSKQEDVDLILVDQKKEYFKKLEELQLRNTELRIQPFSNNMDFDSLLAGVDVLYHLVSTSIPANSNQQVPQELMSNVVFTSLLLEACVRHRISKIVFISSGGTVYGKEACCPLNEETPTYPITSYGVQKITIEKLLYLYHHMYNLDYRVIRLSNPYGPYQRPNGILGAVTTFTERALKDEPIVIYGDGSVVRDFIYIDDAIRAILTITRDDAKHKTYNVGSGYGLSIQELVDIVQSVLKRKSMIEYKQGRNVDVPVNYLDISRYEKEFGQLVFCSIEEGIKRTASFLENNM